MNVHRSKYQLNPQFKNDKYISVKDKLKGLNKNEDGNYAYVNKSLESDYKYERFNKKIE